MTTEQETQEARSQGWQLLTFREAGYQSDDPNKAWFDKDSEFVCWESSLTYELSKEKKKMTQQATAQVLPFTPKPPTFGDMLGATKTTETKTKKGAAPIINNAPPEVKAALDEYLDAETTIKKCKAIKEVSGPVVFDFFSQIQDADGFAGRFNTQYLITGNQHTGKVGNKNAYTLSAEDGPQLAAVLGPEFDRMVTKKAVVTLKAEVFEDEAAQQKLMALLGDSFPEFFEAKITLGVAEGFNRDIYRVVTPEKLADLRVFARQYKPSIR